MTTWLKSTMTCLLIHPARQNTSCLQKILKMHRYCALMDIRMSLQRMYIQDQAKIHITLSTSPSPSRSSGYMLSLRWEIYHVPPALILGQRPNKTQYLNDNQGPGITKYAWDTTLVAQPDCLGSLAE
jgi:hypothetical protein